MEKHLKPSHHKHSLESYISCENLEIITQGLANAAVSSESDHRVSASILQRMFSPEVCHICSKNVRMNKHYRTKKHITKVMGWLKKRFGINNDRINAIFCGACHSVFPTSSAAERHYNSSFHKGNSVNYCENCKKHVKSISSHLTTKYHNEMVDRQAELNNNLNVRVTRADRSKSVTQISDINGKLSDKIAVIRNIYSGNGDVSSSSIDEVPAFDNLLHKFRWPRQNTTKEQYTRITLTMEMRRLKLVLENNTRIPIDLAVQYVHNLNRFVQELIVKEAVFYDIDAVFETVTEFSISQDAEPEQILHEELKNLETKIVIEDNVRVDVALDCITQFNIRLESLIAIQEDNDHF